MMNFEDEKMKCVTRLVIAASLAIIALGVLFGGIKSLRKYDYAVMFSENAVATLQEIKTGRWEVVNARWAMDARGAWNYEFIVRRPAPFFAKKQQAAPAPKAAAPAPAPQAAPVPAPAPAEAPAPKERTRAPKAAPEQTPAAEQAPKE